MGRSFNHISMRQNQRFWFGNRYNVVPHMALTTNLSKYWKFYSSLKTRWNWYVSRTGFRTSEITVIDQPAHWRPYSRL